MTDFLVTKANFEYICGKCKDKADAKLTPDGDKFAVTLVCLNCGYTRYITTKKEITLAPKDN